MNVVKWVNSFDPQKVNNEDLKLPKELKQLNEHTKILIRDFPYEFKAEDSRRLTHLNQSKVGTA